MPSLRGFELYSRWVPLNMKHARAISLGEYSSYVIKAFIN